MAPTLALAGLALFAKGADAKFAKLLPQANMVEAIYRPERQHFLHKLGETEETMERWIVGLKKDAVTAQMDAMLAVPDVKLLFTGVNTALAYRGAHSQVEALVNAHFDIVDYYEPDAEVSAIPEIESTDVRIAENTDDTPWGVARVGAREQSFTGKGVDVYVFDTGVRTTHDEFGGRAFPSYENQGSPKICSISDKQCAIDRQGHGSHCAATAAGNKWGVAIGATVRAVKILSDTGSGSLSWSTTAMHWLSKHDLGGAKAVASMSIGSKGTYHSDEIGVKALTNAGIVVSVAAGNSAGNACGESPAFVASAYTVGAITEKDAMASFSNYGECIDIFAPGTNTYSADPKSDSAGTTLSGTSMACPHVSGAMAVKWEENPSLSRAQLEGEVYQRSDPNAVQGDTKGTKNTAILRVAGVYNSNCDDVGEFKDVWGFSCVWWWPFSCGFTFILSYSPAELVAVRSQCKNSCGICESPPSTNSESL